MASSFTRRVVLEGGLAFGAASSSAATFAWAQAWPSKPIRVICAYPVGGITDLFARTYGEQIALRLGTPVVADNRPGAGGIVAAQALKSAPADGHTLMFTITTSMLANRVLYKSLPYDPDKDFELIAYMPSGPLPLVVAAATAVKDLRELVEFARSRPVNVGTYAPGSFAHIAIAELNRHFGLAMVPVHYRGEAPMWTDLAAGGIHAAIGSLTGAAGILRSGAARAIAVPHVRRMTRLPEVATFVEQGLPSKAFQLTSYICAVAPAGVPMPIIGRLSELMVEAGRSEPIRKLLENFGIDQAAQGREQFQRLHAEEGPTWLELVRSLELTPQ